MSIVPELIEAAVVVGEKFALKEASVAAASSSLKIAEEVLSKGKSLKVASSIGESKAAAEIVGTGFRLYPADLEALKALQSKFPDLPAAQARLAELSPTVHRATAYFLQDGSKAKVDFVARELTGATPLEVLQRPGRLGSMFELDGQLSDSALAHVRKLEMDTPHIAGSVAVVSRGAAGRELVERLAAEGSPGEHFDVHRLTAQLDLEKRFGAGSPTVTDLLHLEAQSGLKLTSAAALPDSLLQGLVKEGNAEAVNTLGAYQSPFTKLATALGTDDAAIERAGKLTLSGELDVKRVNAFISEHSDRAAVTAAEIKRGVSPARLSDRDWLPGMHLVTKHIGDDVESMAALTKYGEQNRNGLWKIGSYLDGAPEERVEAVRKMIKSGTLDDPTQLTRLTMFPQHVAEGIAEAAAPNGYRVENIVGHARDFESGANFVSMTADYLKTHDSLTAKAIENIAADARHSGEMMPAFVEREANAARSATSYTTSQYYTIGSLAADLKSATQIILDKFAPERQIVVLARDMNPFTSLLRANGRKTINFPFSRSQYGDAATAARWNAEVPPGSVVIDSKLNGTIHDAIKKFDPTIEPYLLQSRSPYPQLLPNTRLAQLADHIEVFPKLTGRCTGFSGTAAICRLKSLDQEDVAKPGIQAINATRALLQELGLSDWNVWRYKSFSAVSQSERLGLTQPDHIQQFLQTVEKMRK